MKREIDIALVDRHEIAPGVMHFGFERVDGEVFNYQAGQFITLLIPGPDKVLRRSYSLAAAPLGLNRIEFAASYVKEGVASELLFSLKPGDRLAMIGPAGRLVLPSEPPERLIFVATGTGITPFRAMLPAFAPLLAARVRIEVLQGVRVAAELLYGDEFLTLANGTANFYYHPCFSRELPPIPGARQGYVQHCFADLDLKPHSDLIYLCGNPNMIDEAFAYLTQFGFATQSVRREKYISSN